MSKYVAAIALYGTALFVGGIAWEIVSALYKRHKRPTLPFGYGSSYDSTHEASETRYEVMRH